MSTKLTRTTMLVAALGLATSAFGQNDTYRTKTGASNWATLGSWEYLKAGTWSPAVSIPNAGDTVSILHNLTVDASSGCATLDIAAGTLNITHASSDVTLTVTGNATFTGSFTAGNHGIIDLAGTITFNGSPVVLVQSGGKFQLNGTNMNVAGNSFTVDSGGTLVLYGSTAPFVNVGSGLVLNGLCSMMSSHATNPAYIVVPSTRSLPSAATGEIRGLETGTPLQAEVRIDANAAAVTMTNPGTISGFLAIKGVNTGSNNAVFANNGTVTANIARELLIDASLSSFSDNGSAVWSVNYDDTAAVLRFGKGATGLTGQCQLLQGRGILRISASISTPTLRVDQGRIVVDTSQTFTYGTVSGSCSGSVPASPMNAGSYPSVSTFYCYP